MRASLNRSEVSFGCGGLRLFEASEIERKQVGYSVAPDGTSLCGTGEGQWRPSWIVIGCETACGDPLFIETNNSALPVFTAIHGEDDWEPVPIAISVKVFLTSLEEFAQVAAGRRNPVERDANPLTEDERNLFLGRIAALNDGLVELGFWEALLAS